MLTCTVLLFMLMLFVKMVQQVGAFSFTFYLQTTTPLRKHFQKVKAHLKIQKIWRWQHFTSKKIVSSGLGFTITVCKLLLLELM